MKHSAEAEPGHGSRYRTASLRGALDRVSDHLGRFIEGLLVALAAVVVLEWSSDAATAALALIGSTFALFAGTFYGDIVQREIQGPRSATTAELRRVGRDACPILVRAVPALAVWGGIGLLATIGYLAAHLREASTSGALLHGVGLSLVGVVVLAIKTLH